MPRFIKKDSPEYWNLYPKQISEMGEIMEASKLTPATMHVLGEPDDETAPAALIFTMPPHYVLPRHGHVCERFEIILEGSMIVDGLALGPGDIMIARKGEFYGPHVAGPDGCRTLEVFSTLAAAHHQLSDTPEGVKPLEFGSWAALRASGVDLPATGN